MGTVGRYVLDVSCDAPGCEYGPAMFTGDAPAECLRQARDAGFLVRSVRGPGPALCPDCRFKDRPETSPARPLRTPPPPPFEFGMRVRLRATTTVTVRRGDTRAAVVVGGRHLSHGGAYQLVVLRDGNRWPSTWSADEWEPDPDAAAGERTGGQE